MKIQEEKRASIENAQSSGEIIIKFTSLGTPEENGVVEWIFATLYSRMGIMMVHKELLEKPKSRLCTDFKATTNKIRMLW